MRGKGLRFSGVDALLSLSGFFGADGEGRCGIEGRGGGERRRLDD